MPNWFLLILAGLILRSTSGWFPGQHTTGDILMWAGVAMLAMIIRIAYKQRRMQRELLKASVSVDELADALQRAADRQEQ